MDETNPAYENFLNNMSRMGRTPRETTRRVSASKFLGRDNLETRIKLNERKISIIKNIIRTQQMTTAMMMASLVDPNQGVDQNIVDIKKTVTSILLTLKAQEKFEMKQFLDMQRRSENERRRNRESLLEGVGNKGQNLINRGVQKVLSPVTNIFSRILNGFIALVGGQVLMGLIDVLSNPVVSRVLLTLTGFVEKVFPIVAGVVGSALFGIIRLLDEMGVLVPLMYTVAGFAALRPVIGLASSSFGPTRVPRLGSFKTAPTNKKMGMMFNPKMYKFFRFGLGRKFNKGGLVPGVGNTDTVPAMLTPGEVVISKPAVEKFGVMNLLNLNKAAGSSGEAKIKNNITYANEGAVATPTVGDMFTSLLSSLGDIENSDVGKALTDRSIPETLRGFSELMSLSPIEQSSTAEAIKKTVFNRITKGLTTSDFAKKMVTSESTPPNLLPFNKLATTASELNIKSLFDDVLNKVNPQNDAPLNNDTFSIQLDSPNQNKLETLGLII